MNLDKRFSDQELERIVDEAAIYMCACPGQVAVQLRALRELFRYQYRCELEPGQEAEVHRTIAEATRRAHEVMELSGKRLAHGGLGPGYPEHA